MWAMRGEGQVLLGVGRAEALNGAGLGRMQAYINGGRPGGRLICLRRAMRQCCSVRDNLTLLKRELALAALTHLRISYAGLTAGWHAQGRWASATRCRTTTS